MPDNCGESAAHDAASAIEHAFTFSLSAINGPLNRIAQSVESLVEQATSCCDSVSAASRQDIVQRAERADALTGSITCNVALDVQSRISRVTTLLDDVDRTIALDDAPTPPQDEQPAPADDSADTQPEPPPEPTGEPEGEPEPTGEDEPIPPAERPRTPIPTAALDAVNDPCAPARYLPLSNLTSIVRAVTGAIEAAPPAQRGILDGLLDVVLRQVGIPTIGGSVSASLVDQALTSTKNVVENLATVLGCGGAAVHASTASVVRDLLAQWISPSIGELTKSLDYSRRALCPTEFPSAAEAIAAYNANAISEDLLRNWLAINNQCWEPAKPVIEAARRKLQPEDLVVARRRGLISDQQFANDIRALGFTRASDAATIKNLGIWVPGPSDQIRFMVRDVHNAPLVARFSMDDGFDKNFRDSSEAQELARKQGVQEADMLNLWRAHWDIPAPGQLFSMLHRLPFVSEDFRNQINGTLERLGFSGRLEAQTRQQITDDVATALVQQDILPFWVPRLMALSFRPMTRREIVAAYNGGSIDRAGAIDRFREFGVNETNAIALADMLQVNRDRQAAALLPTRLYKAEVIGKAEAKRRLEAMGVRPAAIDETLNDADVAYHGGVEAKAYGRNEITRDIARQRLVNKGVQDFVADEILQRVDSQRTKSHQLMRYEAGIVDKPTAKAAMVAEGFPDRRADEFLSRVDDKLDDTLKRECARAIEKRFLLGEFDLLQAENFLNGQGLAPQRVQWWIGRMRCKRDSLGKHPPTSQLCRWLDRGMINGQEFIARLVRIGWNPDDASRVLVDCVNRNLERRQKDAEQAGRRAAAELRRAQGQARTLANRTEAQIRAQQRAAERAVIARERREKRIVKAADKLAARLEIDLGDAMQQVRAAVHRGRDEFGFGPDERIDVVEQAAEKWPASDERPFHARWLDVARARDAAQTNGAIV